MDWDQGKREPRVHLWEWLVFAALPLLLLIMGVGEYFEVSRFILGFIFLFIPVVFVFCVMAFDQVRHRNGFWLK
jgi:hypothetical protein